MSLASLSCNNSSVSDLTPLKGMPLESLHFGNTKVTDLSPLADMELQSIRFTPRNIKKGMDVIRKLEYLNDFFVDSGKDVRRFDGEGFWGKYDAGEFKE